MAPDGRPAAHWTAYPAPRRSALAALHKAARGVLGGALLGCLAFGCGRDDSALRWVGKTPAVLHCTTSGRRATPVVMRGLPVPAPPTGLLARQLDPSTLDAIGFQRDALVCAALQPPDGTQVAAAREGMPRLVAMHEQISAQALNLAGQCVCEVARQAERRDLIAACANMPTRRGCDGLDRGAALGLVVAPLVQTVKEVPLPWVHWRLVGPTDRPGWFARHVAELVAHHPGGSRVYLPATGPGPDPIVARLFRIPEVVAAVRQDSGRALLVAREQDGQLILDHFVAPAAAAGRRGLVRAAEQAHVEDLIAALAQPRGTPELLAGPKPGDFVQFDVAALAAVDDMTAAAAVLRQGRPPASRSSAAAGWVEGGVLWASSGEALHLGLVLSPVGQRWAQALGDGPLFGHIDELRAADVGDPAASSVSASPTSAGFIAGGTPFERVFVDGLQRVATLLRDLEVAFPGAVGGSLSAWQVDLPAGALPAAYAASGAFGGLQQQFGERPYRVSAHFEQDRSRLLIEVAPP